MLLQVLGHKPEQTVPGNEKQPYLNENPIQETNPQGNKLRIEVVTVVFIQPFLTDPFPHS